MGNDSFSQCRRGELKHDTYRNAGTANTLLYLSGRCHCGHLAHGTDLPTIGVFTVARANDHSAAQKPDPAMIRRTGEMAAFPGVSSRHRLDTAKRASPRGAMSARTSRPRELSPFALCSPNSKTSASHGSGRRHWRLPASRASHRGLLPHRECVCPRSSARQSWRRPCRQR